MRKKARPEIQQIPENLSDFWCATSSDTSSDGDAKGISISIFLENTTELDWMLVSNVFQIFTQIPEEMIQFDLYFEEGLKPPTSKSLENDQMFEKTLSCLLIVLF